MLPTRLPGGTSQRISISSLRATLDSARARHSQEHLLYASAPTAAGPSTQLHQKYCPPLTPSWGRRWAESPASSSADSDSSGFSRPGSPSSDLDWDRLSTTSSYSVSSVSLPSRATITSCPNASPRHPDEHQPGRNSTPASRRVVNPQRLEVPAVSLPPHESSEMEATTKRYLYRGGETQVASGGVKLGRSESRPMSCSGNMRLRTGRRTAPRFNRRK